MKRLGGIATAILAAMMMQSCVPCRVTAPEPPVRSGAPAGRRTVRTSGRVLPRVQPLVLEPGPLKLTAEHVEQALENGLLKEREYLLDNGDTVSFFSFTAAEDTQQESVVFTTVLPTDSVLHSVEVGGGPWTEQPAAEGSFTVSMVMTDGEETYLMAYVPQSWEPMEQSSRRYHSTGTVQLAPAEDGGWQLTLNAPPMEAGWTADFMVVQSRSPLMDWSNEAMARLWASYHNSGEGRWYFDGYYWPAYDTYLPTGKNVYFPMTDAYLCKSMLALASGHRLSNDLAACMLDVMAQRQNPQGFLPTASASLWLLEDYGIGPGFYDTRFNADVMLMFVDGWERYGYEQFRQTLERYGDFIVGYAAEHSRTTESGGLLLDDYYHPEGGQPTHTSLNHQLAQILLLYRMGEALERPDLTKLADRMLQAVVDTEEQWIAPNSNLHYAVYSNGAYGGTDYPYLTYNDLFLMQEYLQETTGSRNESLQRLMEAKKTWMDWNGVTGYLQS